ncbi:SH3 domain-containing C40 family peptidase [Psychromonas ossibalaenae]|uniref:SH3 domain-containing C40 family peptidase n=1 Tax=Psychromonas ossibalaenae TaxID=444922 RepID=UPI00037AC02A|nr:SH3 domain-containing C40 family peptidase [Psychromonas ossibalaenae]
MDKYKVTANTLHLRKEPSLEGEILGYLIKNEEISRISISEDGYWYQIRRENNIAGWVSHKYLGKVAEHVTSDLNRPWIHYANNEIGVKEYRGERDNSRIVEYLKSTSLGTPYNENDETAWCSAFVNWCVESSGYEGTDSAWARDWLNWGERTNNPEKGDIVVFSRGDGGHVGFYIEENNNEIIVLGGNQSNAVKISPYPRSRVLGYRKPGE